MGTTYSFKAETSKVLAILTHSLYTNREIFLRELISNASDAEEKVRFMQTKGEQVVDGDLPLEIRIKVDKTAKTLTVSDAGLGMTADDMEHDLGVIAHSGTEQFIKELEAGKEDASSIIGRFGIGFYSVFMVADRVEVVSRPTKGGAPNKWTSDGVGEFTIDALPDDGSVKRGTSVTLFLKKDAEDFLETWELESVVRKHSAFVQFPIFLDDKRLNTTPALWREPKSGIKPEQYEEFYKFLTYDTTAPLASLHVNVDVPVQFAGLMFIPDRKSDPYQLQREKWGLDLYVRRVLIERENRSLLPDYLSFCKGIVDTEDLPLNISRETLQENVVLRKISQTVTKQILSELERMADKEPETYARFWRQHGGVFTLGYNDFANKDRVAKLLRYDSSNSDKESLVSFDEYVGRAKDGQKEIWFVAAANREAAQVNPYLEKFRSKGIEVLFLYEPVDEFALQALDKYKDFAFKSVEMADMSVIDTFPDCVADKPKESPLNPDEESVFDGLVARIKTVLGEQVKDVRISKRLTDSPACLVSADEHVTSNMDKIMRMMQKDETVPQKIFEINRDHKLLRSLLRVYRAGADDALLNGMIQNLFDAALLTDGYLKDPYALAGRMNTLLERAGGWYADLREMK